MGRVFGVAWSKYENKNAKNKQQVIKTIKSGLWQAKVLSSINAFQ